MSENPNEAVDEKEQWSMAVHQLGYDAVKFGLWLETTGRVINKTIDGLAGLINKVDDNKQLDENDRMFFETSKKIIDTLWERVAAGTLTLMEDKTILKFAQTFNAPFAAEINKSHPAN